MHSDHFFKLCGIVVFQTSKLIQISDVSVCGYKLESITCTEWLGGVGVGCGVGSQTLLIINSKT